ncbi:virulence factor SrfB [Leclercia adecarboxylata]|uniref:virulence factor SrfB n=1 Tax=Leclercia adecarboxylata TaxID=83655 RepID=UPI002AB24030|nr:virulence factor SrfB [Leclercia adecarboxylata]
MGACAVPRAGRTDEKGNTWRAILIFDTKISPDRETRNIWLPAKMTCALEPVCAGPAPARDGRFLTLPWVEVVARSVQHPGARRARQHAEDIDEKLGAKRAQAHYLNLLNILDATVAIPEVQVND